MTSHIEDPLLAKVFGLGFNPIKVSRALLEKDENFSATMRDLYEAGYRVEHRGCGTLDSQGICEICGEKFT